MSSKEYRELLIYQIKALAYDLDNLAEDLVGEADLITNFEIRLKFFPDSVPTVELVREHIGRQASQVRINKLDLSINQWKQASEYIYKMKEYYEEIPHGRLALGLVINPLIERYESGERTKELYQEIWDVQ